MKLFFLSFTLFATSAFAQWNSQFHTQIHEQLSVSGVICRGGETVYGSEKECLKGEWLVTVDNLNLCSRDGICTQIHVSPFIAKLQKADVISITTISFYDVIPLTPITEDVALVLETYWMRDHFNGKAMMVRK